jgi:hypothetical protein
MRVGSKANFFFFFKNNFIIILLPEKVVKIFIKIPWEFPITIEQTGGRTGLNVGSTLHQAQVGDPPPPPNQVLVLL